MSNIQHHGHSNEFPKVTLFTQGEKKIEQDYPNLYIQPLYNSNIAKELNSIFQKKEPHEIYGYMSKYQNFTKKNSLSKIIQCFQFCPNIACVYTDEIIKKNKFRIDSYNTCSNKIIPQPIVSAIFTLVNIDFNPNLDILLTFDALLRLKTRTMCFHIAEPLIEINVSDNYEYNNLILSELKCLKQ